MSPDQAHQASPVLSATAVVTKQLWCALCRATREFVVSPVTDHAYCGTCGNRSDSAWRRP